MNIWVIGALVVGLVLIAFLLPKIIPSLVALSCFAFCLYLSYTFFGIWGAVIVGIITAAASIYLSFKALDFLEKYDIQIKRKK